MDDVISQGREPERDVRSPLSRRWRVAAGTLAVAVAGLVAIGFGLRHDTGSPGAPGATGSPAASATGGAGADPVSVPAILAPAPQGHAAMVICSPSTGACSMRGARRQILVRFDGLHAG